MNIRERIGQRILAARKKVGYSVQEVADKTKSLKQRRISNYEQGIRTPGPDEIMQLADVLHVSPAYLMCLSDDEKININIADYFGQKIVPVLSLKDALNYKEILKQHYATNLEKYDHIIIDDKNAKNLEKDAFAIEIDDESMVPTFHLGDRVIFNPTTKPTPGKIVIARLADSPKACVRSYREPGTSHVGETAFELVPLNANWPTKIIKNENDGAIIGMMIEHRHYNKN